ncbi:hypothetical protein L4D76_00235 [Photobacterium sagamiensis]|uniref:hypothetical protein n=1 Tax=Photobacterium sagamiensis TaxID=2910241 RepID=UPI003D13D30C
MLSYLSDWHHYVYGILTIMFFLVYVLHFLPGGKLGPFKAILETQTVLMLVLIFVAVIAARVEQTAKIAEKRWEKASALINRQGYHEFKQITTTESIFRELSDVLSRTEKEVWATAFRPDTRKVLTSYSSGAEQWYENLNRWTVAKSGRTYLRLIGLNNDETREWLQEECTSHSNISNKLFKGIEWDPSMPIINMIIFDDDEVFLMFRSDPALIEQTIRYRIKGPEMAHLAKEWFKAMWAIAKDCNEL